MRFQYIEIVGKSDVGFFSAPLTAVVKYIWSHWKRHDSIPIVIWKCNSRTAMLHRCHLH